MKSYYIVSIVIVLVVCVGTPLVVTGSYYLCESMPFIEAARQREEEAKQELKRAREIAEAKREAEEEVLRIKTEAAERRRKEVAEAEERRRREDAEATGQRIMKETTTVEQRKQDNPEIELNNAMQWFVEAFECVDKRDFEQAQKLVDNAKKTIERYSKDRPELVEKIAHEATERIAIIELNIAKAWLKEADTYFHNVRDNGNLKRIEMLAMKAARTAEIHRKKLSELTGDDEGDEKIIKGARVLAENIANDAEMFLDEVKKWESLIEFEKERKEYLDSVKQRMF